MAFLARNQKQKGGQTKQLSNMPMPSFKFPLRTNGSTATIATAARAAGGGGGGLFFPTTTTTRSSHQADYTHAVLYALPFFIFIFIFIPPPPRGLLFFLFFYFFLNFSYRSSAPGSWGSRSLDSSLAVEAAVAAAAAAQQPSSSRGMDLWGWRRAVGIQR